MNNLKILVLLYLLNTCFFSQAQESDMIEGIVSELSGDTELPIIGANIYYANNPQIGTTTDLKGHFEIERLTTDQLLVVSFIGFANDTIDITGLKSLDLILSKSVELNTIEIVSRQKTTSISYMNPLRVDNIGEKELLKAACCNLSESFETSPSVDVSFTDAVTGTKTIQMLGLSGPYIQTTSGNMPDVRGLTTLHGLELIPGTWIESIQLIKGTGSVINGFESISGQINTEIKNPESKDKLNLNFYANRGSRMEGNLVWKKKINAKLSTNLLSHGSTIFKAMDRNSDSFADMPLSKQVSNQINLHYVGNNGFRSRIGIKASVIEKKGGQLLTSVANPYLYKINGKNAQIWGKAGKVNTSNPNRSTGLQMSASYYNQVSSFGLRQYDATQTSFYGNLINQLEIVNTKHILKFGASILYDNYSEKLNATDYHREEIVPGVFSEYTFDPNKKFTVVVGGRVDYHNQFGLFLTPRLHWRYALKEGTVIRGTAGRGQRTANIFSENIGMLATSRAIRFKSDPTQYAYGLNPEVAWNYGLSLTQNFNLNYRDGVISVDFYRTDFQNQIIVDLDINPQEVWFYNLSGMSYSNSFQIQLDYELIRRLDIRMAYRWFDVVSNYDNTQKIKPLLSPHRGFINMGYETKKSLNFDLTAQVQGKKRIPSTQSNPITYQRETMSPVFFLINGQISKTWLGKTEIYLGIENLLNYKQKNPIIASSEPFGKYFDSSLIWGPIFGRNIYFGFRYKI